ncbi:MAG: putative selenium-dependent hydroxylase accessory protein YqeC [Spirochaetales bacterium]|nr:putative selenium-dependent hydroxylase accessory protein YqeC [Spirochaetales bacterium]
MNLIKAFSMQTSKQLTIAFVGGGGKSTTIYRLALELAEKQKKVLVTTTTMIFHPKEKKRPYHNLFIGKVDLIMKNFSPAKGNITVAGKKIIANGKKIKGFAPEELTHIQKSGIFDIILVEADGARGKPIKAPEEYEPVIPTAADIVAGVIGMDCLGTKINENNVHRPELFTKITNSSIDDIIETQIVNNLLNSPSGLFKDTSPKSRKIVIFNKSDTAYRILEAKKIAENISESLNIERILITSMTGNDPVMAVIELNSRS